MMQKWYSVGSMTATLLWSWGVSLGRVPWKEGVNFGSLVSIQTAQLIGDTNPASGVVT